MNLRQYQFSAVFMCARIVTMLSPTRAEIRDVGGLIHEVTIPVSPNSQVGAWVAMSPGRPTLIYSAEAFDHEFNPVAGAELL